VHGATFLSLIGSGIHLPIVDAAGRFWSLMIF